MSITMDELRQGAGKALRSDAGQIRATPRDTELLPWVVEMDGMPADLLARKGATSVGAVRNLLSRWRRAGWIESGRIDAGPAWCWATKEGVTRFGRADYVPRPPSTARAAHTRAVIEARLMLERNTPDLQWRSERELRAGKGVGTGHFPDAVISRPDEVAERGEIALEVELTRKPTDRIRAIMQELLGPAHEGGYPRVLYLAAPEVLPVLQRVRDEMGARAASVQVMELKR